MELSPVGGFQLYVLPPLALSCVLLPGQTDAFDPALAVIEVLTVTVTVVVLVQPAALAPPTV